MWSVRYYREAGQPERRVEDPQPRRVRVHRCLFSDGGLTSNFPLMLFDEVVPQRPLLAVNLQYRTRDDQAFLAGKRLWQPFHQPIPDAPAFVTALVESARNWFDQSLLSLPGYAERVVSVTIPRGLGGLNLGMDAAKITWLLSKGTAAGRLLRQRFEAGSRDRWNFQGLQAFTWRNVTADLGDLLMAYQATYLFPPGCIRRWDRGAGVLRASVAFMPLTPQGAPFVPNTTTLTLRERQALFQLSRAAQAVRAAQRAHREALFPTATPWNTLPYRDLRGILRYRPFL